MLGQLLYDLSHNSMSKTYRVIAFDAGIRIEVIKNFGDGDVVKSSQFIPWRDVMLYPDSIDETIERAINMMDFCAEHHENRE